MLPIPKKHKKILVWVAAASFTLSLTVGVSHSRMKEWTSTEMVFTPTAPTQTEDGYSSNCLVAGGQDILLADWDSATTERTVVIGVTRPEGSYHPEISEITEPEDPPEIMEPEETEPTDPPEPSEPSEEPEVVLTTDSPYITCAATVGEESITLVLTRVSPVTEVTNAAIHVAWQGLEGTISVNLLPEEDPPSQEAENPIPGTLSVDSCGVMNSETLLAHILVDPTAKAVTFSQNGQALHLVRCSLDRGQSYTLLYDGGTLPLENAPIDWDGLLLVDFSMALTGNQDVTVNANAEARTGTCTLTLQAKTEVTPLFLKASNLPCPVSVRTVWGNADVHLQVQKLETDENGQLVYRNSDAVTAVPSDSAVILRANGQPEPGTYRLVVTWIWNTISVEEQMIYFVINTK